APPPLVPPCRPCPLPRQRRLATPYAARVGDAYSFSSRTRCVEDLPDPEHPSGIVSVMHEPTICTDELRPTFLEVDLGILAANYRAIAAHVAPARVMPILKANAYGHGLVEVARALEACGAPYVGVAYLEEGIRLRQHGVRLPVLVLGGIVGSQVPRFLEHDLTLTASS